MVWYGTHRTNTPAPIVHVHIEADEQWAKHGQSTTHTTIPESTEEYGIAVISSMDKLNLYIPLFVLSSPHGCHSKNAWNQFSTSSAILLLVAMINVKGVSLLCLV